MPRNVVVVGAGVAGGQVVEELRALGYDGRLTLVGEEIHRPYERPPLSKRVLTGAQTMSSTYLQSEQFYLDNDVRLVLGQPVARISPEDVELTDGTSFPSDAVVVATGARPRQLKVDGAHLSGVQAFRNAEDADSLRAAVLDGARVVVVGAGFIGCEVAASARSMGADVTLVEMGATPLERVLGTDLGRYMQRLHVERGVAVRTGATVEKLVGSRAVSGVQLSDGSVVAADVVVVGVGVEPVVDPVLGLDLCTDGGIEVDEFGRTAFPGLFAAGDVTRCRDQATGELVRIEHYQNAQRQAGSAARAVLGQLESSQGVPWFWSDQYDVNLQVLGRAAQWDEIVIRGRPDDGRFVAFCLQDENIVQAMAVNAGKELRSVRVLIEHGVPVSGAELCDEGVDLRALARSGPPT